MSSRKWKFRIHHILESIGKIQTYTADMTSEDFFTNEMVIDAVIRNLIVIGEATRHIPIDITSTNPEIPWRLMQDMRNFVIHDYPNVELIVVWNTIQNDLPPLIEPLQRLLKTVTE